MDQRIDAGARVTLTIEISSLGSWGGDCTVAQIYKQAAEEAVGRLRNLIGKHQLMHSMKIVGEPQVTGVFTMEKPK